MEGWNWKENKINKGTQKRKKKRVKKNEDRNWNKK
jgi:hypothetical protein